MTQVDARLAAYAAKVAEALESVGTFDSGYGTFYVANIRIDYDGEPSGVSLIPNDFENGFDIQID